MLKALAIWYLRKRKASVLINFEVNGGEITQRTNNGYYYDNILNDTVVSEAITDEDTYTVINIPKGEFHQKYND